MAQAGFKERIQHASAAALKAVFDLELPAADVLVQETAANFEGDYTVVLFPLLKHKLGKPEDVGAKLGDALQAAMPEVASHHTVKGFLNLTLAPAAWQAFLQSSHADANAYLEQDWAKGQKVMVEFSSPNTNKPLHLGHLRNNFLGDSISRILVAVGYEVIRTNLINDRGVHICKSMLAWRQFGGKSPEEEGLKGDHLVGKYYVRFEQELRQQASSLAEQEGMDIDEAKKKAPLQLEVQNMLRLWEAQDPEVIALWKKMNGWVYQGFEATYRRMGISFDKKYYESDTYLLGKGMLKEMLAAGICHRRDDGSVWADLTDENLDEKLLLRSDGTSVYMTQDLGTADLKYEDYGMQKSVYVVGNEQDYHFKVLFVLLKKLGRPYADGLYHLSYGMVELPEGKMKSREGKVVDADELMQDVVDHAAAETAERGKVEGMSDAELAELHEMLGIGALKYFLLKVGPVKKMLFNPKESVSLQGDTGPFIQYTHARIHSLLAKAGQMGHKPAVPGELTEPAPSEKAILRKLQAWRETLTASAEQYDPSLLANYLVELAKAYNRFYNEVPILKGDEDEQVPYRLALSELAARTLAFGMGLLGIGCPERM